MKEQEVNYKIALEAHQILLKSLVPGIQLNALMAKAIKYIESKKPELVDKMTKNCGYGVNSVEDDWLII